jgi:TP901 family phage tail tape measure protein
MPAGTKGGIKAGRAFIVIGAVDRTAMVMRRIAAKMKAFGARMAAIGQQMMMQSLLILVPAGLAIKKFATFDDALKKVEARAKGTDKQLAELREQAKELGRTTSFTAVQVGELQASLGQKGFGRGQIKDMTEHVLALARAAGEGGEADVTVAADVIAGTLKAFKMESEDAAEVADAFAFAVNNSNFTLQGMMDGMQKVAPMAHQMGLSLEETIATLASMTNLNIQATEAGTAMTSFLARMSKAEFTGKFNKGLEDAGIAAVKFRDAEGDLRGPLELFAEINEKTKDLGTAAKADILSVLFGVRQFGKAMGGMGEAVNSIDLFNRLVNEAGGTALKTSKKMDEGLGGAFRMLKSALEGVQIAIGEALEEPLQKLGAQLITFLGGMTEWIEKNKGLIVLIVSIGAAMAATGLTLLIVGGIIKLIGAAIGVLAFAFTALKVAIGLLISPFGLVVLAIAAVGVALYALSSDAREIMNKIGGFIAEKFKAIGETIGETFKGILDAIAVGDLQAAWEIFGQGITTTWLQVVDTLATAWENFATFFVEAWQGAKMAIKQTWFGIQKEISTGILRLAEDAGVLGELLDVVVGTDVSETKAKSEALEVQRQQILRNRLRTFQDEMKELEEQRRRAGPGTELHKELGESIETLQVRIDDLMESVGTLNNGYEDSIANMQQTFDDKIEQAAVDAAQSLASWDDKVSASRKAREAEIKTEKEALRRMLDEIRARRDQKEQLDAMAEMDKERMEAEEAFGKSMMEGVAGQGPLAPGLPGIDVTPQKALEQGTVAAAQKVAEIQFREGTANKQLAEARKTNDLLEEQNVMLKELEPVGGV